METYMAKDFASQKKIFSSLMAKSLEYAEPSVDEHGFFILKSEDLCSLEIDPSLDQETRIQLAFDNFEASLEEIPDERSTATRYVVA